MWSQPTKMPRSRINIEKMKDIHNRDLPPKRMTRWTTHYIIDDSENRPRGVEDGQGRVTEVEMGNFTIRKADMVLGNNTGEITVDVQKMAVDSSYSLSIDPNAEVTVTGEMYWAVTSGDSSGMSINGDAVVGETLQVSHDVNDPDGVSESVFAYQWSRDAVDVQGATTASYTLSSDDIGASMACMVSYTDDTGFAEFVHATQPGVVVTRPAIDISSVHVNAANKSNAPITVLFVTSRATTSLSAEGVSVINGTLGAISVVDGDGDANTRFSAVFTPTEDGACSIQVGAAAFTDDEHGVDNMASDAFTWTHDTQVPIITLLGSAAVVHPIGTAYTDAGAVADDNGVSVSISHVASSNPANFQVSSPPHVADVAGEYTVTYSYTDDAENTATAVRSVTVRPSKATITSGLLFKDSNPMITGRSRANSTVKAALSGSDAVFEAAVNNDTLAWHMELTGLVEERDYEFTFTVKSNGVASLPDLLTVVIDKTPPDIVLTGGTSIYHPFGVQYQDAFEVSGDDGNGVQVSGAVDHTQVDESFTLSYTSSDAAGNETNATRHVHVESQMPLILHVGAPRSVVVGSYVPFEISASKVGNSANALLYRVEGSGIEGSGWVSESELEVLSVAGTDVDNVVTVSVRDGIDHASTVATASVHLHVADTLQDMISSTISTLETLVSGGEGVENASKVAGASRSLKYAHDDAMSNVDMKRALSLLGPGLIHATMSDVAQYKATRQGDRSSKMESRTSQMRTIAAYKLAKSADPGVQMTVDDIRQIGSQPIVDTEFHADDVIFGMAYSDFSGSGDTFKLHTRKAVPRDDPENFSWNGSGANDPQRHIQTLQANGKQIVRATGYRDGALISGRQSEWQAWVLHLFHLPKLSEVVLRDASGAIIPRLSDGGEENYSVYESLDDVVEKYGAVIDHTEDGESTNLIVGQHTFTTVEVTSVTDWSVQWDDWEEPDDAAVTGAKLNVSYTAPPSTVGTALIQYQVDGTDEGSWQELASVSLTGVTVPGSASLTVSLSANSTHSVYYRVVINQNSTDASQPVVTSQFGNGADPETMYQTIAISGDGGGESAGGASGDPFIVPLLTL